MPNATIVIPCYNEERRLDIETYLCFSEKNRNIHFLFVNDGSKDKTLDILKDASEKSKCIKYLDLAKNVGKAEAVRLGIKSALEMETSYVGFYDADMATPLKDMLQMIQYISSSELYMVSGCRFKRMGGQIDRRFSRFLFGRIFATCAANILKLPVYDTQCGAKMFHSNVAREIFNTPFISKWLFDVELYARMIQKYGYKKTLEKVVEYPLSKWVDVEGSKLGFKEIIRQPLNLLRIRNHYKLKKYA